MTCLADDFAKVLQSTFCLPHFHKFSPRLKGCSGLFGPPRALYDQVDATMDNYGQMSMQSAPPLCCMLYQCSSSVVAVHHQRLYVI